jgi:glycerophosphoryl diester phosphodiesterase
MTVDRLDFRPRQCTLASTALLIAACLLSGCNDGHKGGNMARFQTLDGNPPLVIGHRGLPGLFPEEAQLSYEKAADVGADALEADLHLTRDCVLVTRHNPWLSDNTNIAAVAASNPAVAARKRTVPGRLVNVTYDLATHGGPAQYLTDLTDPSDPKSVLKSLIVDGEDHTGDWSITDFTLAELKQWVRGTTYDARDERPTVDNGKYPVLSFQEVIYIAKARSQSAGRTLSVFVEAKNPIWNNAQAIANGCGAAGSHPFEDAILRIISDNGLNSKQAPMAVQSFDPESLKYFRSAGLKTRVVLLVDSNAVDYKTGAVICRTDDAATFVTGRPYSWTLAGDGRYFADLLTPAGLAEVKTYADIIGVWKPYAMSWLISPFPSSKADGTPFGGTLADVNKVVPTGLIKDAHALGLFVYSYTFRDETRYLPGIYRGDPKAELIQFFEAGLDGAFTDFGNTAVAARKDFLDRRGHY